MIDLGPILEHYEVEYDEDRMGNQKIHCPAHDDSVASASVNLEEGLINCFGCGLKGDAITLVMVREGLNFVEGKRFAESISREIDGQVSRESGRGDSFLPRRQGSRPGRRRWVSPWARRRP